jgi:hypothetical protein
MLFATSVLVDFIKVFALVMLFLLIVSLAVASFLPKQTTTRPRIDRDDDYYK